MTLKFHTLSFIVTLSILAVFSFIGQVHAQLDPTFGTNGVTTVDLGSEDATLRSFVLPDGKILVVAVSVINNQQKSFFLRYNSNGTPDLTYGTNGMAELAIPYFNANLGQMFDATRQPDGKIVLVGRDRFGNDWRPMIARYNENATLDTSFEISRPNISQFGNDRFYSVIIQPDGKILVAGGSESGSFYPNLSLMRYNSNGTVDTSFGTNNTGFIVHTGPVIFPGNEGAEFLYLQSTGKIIVGTLREGLTSSPDTSRGKVRRFNSDGTVDNSFTVLSFTDGLEFRSVFVLPDDKILVGIASAKNEPLERVHYDAVIKRHNADGSLDTSFGTAGQVSFDMASMSDDSPKGFQLMPDGQIFVAVNVYIFPNRSTYRGNWLAFARLSSNGAVNGKFLAAQSIDHERSIINVLPDGKILTTVRGRIWTNGGVMLARTTGVPLQSYLFHAIPFDFPSTFYASTDPGVFRPSDNRFHFYPSVDLNNITLQPGDIIAPADYISDYNCELAYFRPSEGNWHIIRNFWGSGTNRLVVRWGLAGDIPVPADYNGDGKDDIAVFRPSNGTWYIYNIADGSYSISQWGLNGDKPAQGDFDGDGKADIGVYRPSEGNWYIQRSSDGGYTILHFGLDGDIPVQEDYDGDGIFDIAVYRPSNGVWYRLNSSDGSFFPYQWGLPGDIPVPGNYDSDLKTNIAVWRPSNGTWYVVNPDYASMISYVWGIAGDRPIPAKY